MHYLDFENIFLEVNYSNDQIIFKRGVTDNYRVCLLKAMDSVSKYLTISGL